MEDVTEGTSSGSTLDWVELDSGVFSTTCVSLASSAEDSVEVSAASDEELSSGTTHRLLQHALSLYHGLREVAREVEATPTAKAPATPSALLQELDDQFPELASLEDTIDAFSPTKRPRTAAPSPLPDPALATSPAVSAFSLARNIPIPVDACAPSPNYEMSTSSSASCLHAGTAPEAPRAAEHLPGAMSLSDQDDCWRSAALAKHVKNLVRTRALQQQVPCEAQVSAPDVAAASADGMGNAVQRPLYASAMPVCGRQTHVFERQELPWETMARLQRQDGKLAREQGTSQRRRPVIDHAGTAPGSSAPEEVSPQSPDLEQPPNLKCGPHGNPAALCSSSSKGSLTLPVPARSALYTPPSRSALSGTTASLTSSQECLSDTSSPDDVESSSPTIIAAASSEGARTSEELTAVSDEAMLQCCDPWARRAAVSTVGCLLCLFVVVALLVD